MFVVGDKVMVHIPESIIDSSRCCSICGLGIVNNMTNNHGKIFKVEGVDEEFRYGYHHLDDGSGDDEGWKGWNYCEHLLIKIDKEPYKD